MADDPSRRWRNYETASGRQPVREFIRALTDEHAALIFAAMKDVRRRGLREARHLDGDIWEVRVDAPPVIYRILFAPEGKRSQVLLSLSGFTKKTQKTPPNEIRLAKRRLADWRARGDAAKAKRSGGPRSPRRRGPDHRTGR